MASLSDFHLHMDKSSKKDAIKEFSGDEKSLIARLFDLVGKRWALIAGRIPGRTAEEIENYHTSECSSPETLSDKDSLKEFSEDEEMLIARMLKLIGKRWSLVAGRVPGRTAEEIENYWTSKCLSPKQARQSSMRAREFSEDEEALIARMFKLVGERWHLIAGRIPGRRAEEIEIYWNGRYS